MYIFLDESGNFKDNKNDYFIVGGFITNTPNKTAKIFRKWQYSKFKNRKLRHRQEVKFSDTRLTEKMRLKTIEHLGSQDIRVFYSVLNRTNIPLEYRKKKQIKSGLLYAEIVAQTLNLLMPISETEFRVFRDRRHLKNISEQKFSEIVQLSILPNLPAKTIVQIKSLDSAQSPNIQIAGWICGALSRCYNNIRNGREYFLKIKNNIIVSKELFEKYWEGHFRNKKSPPAR